MNAERLEVIEPTMMRSFVTYLAQRSNPSRSPTTAKRRMLVGLLLVVGCVRGTPEEMPTDAAPDAADAAYPIDAPVSIDAPVMTIPQVIATTPVNGATGVESSVVIQATFSEDMTASSLDASTFVVTFDGTRVDGSVAYAAPTRTATFTPTLALRRAGAYSAMLTTEVRNLAGTALVDGVSWAFTIDGGHWSAPELIETVDLGDAYTPQVAVDAAGNATVVWAQSDGTISNIWANRFVPGAGWGTTTRIETDDVSPGRFASIAVDPAGNVFATWPQPDGIGASRFVPGVGWGAPQLIAAATGATQPRVAVDLAGNALAVWTQSAGVSSYSLWTSRFEPGAGWGTAELRAMSPFPLGAPHVAIASTGVAMVVWAQSSPLFESPMLTQFTMLRSLRHTPGGGWEDGGPSRGASFGDHNDFPHIVADAQGGFAIVWQNNHSAVLFNRYFAGSGWRVFPSGVSSGSSPHVAVDPSGNATAVWHDNTTGVDTIGLAKFVTGFWIAAPPIATGIVNAPQLAVSPAGEVVVVWAQASAGRWSIWSNQPSNTLLETDDAGDASEPQVVFDPRGNATAVWQQSDGTRLSIWASTFH